ncbi:exodeoxyribonuclease V subunit gamma [Mycobacterium sp. M1]|uniref:RecBCD enzyme subunit RecC n=1 Tax=Mycolicibacter acidiphilus TaxID=2835306 RepID=A0ABS5RL00_9MYCO|nr:exodeoxyribonuclease V subunit gamma [Mycolicibacter acidiphilus]MBS9534967.1 exodeoxyribonuclease V subunit gamma [Mycolicibacter acidiphilus]
MALHLHRAARADQLADGLAALLSTPPTDPFAQELVLVPARGVERWLSQRLSHTLGAGPGGDGVCAAVQFRSPAALLTELTGAAEDDPWSPDALVWPLLSVLDAHLDAPWCATLARHLGHFHTGDDAQVRRGRRYAVARRLAGLFASYARQRPQLLIDWLAGGAGDGAGGELDADLRWQPPLWRELVAAVPADPPHLRHRQTVEQLRGTPVDTLPARLSLFGHTRLSCTDIELLDALAVHHDLHLWLPHPSDELWQALRGLHGAVVRGADDSRLLASHPLLQTLGRDLRELQRGLPDSAASDEYTSGTAASATLLSWLQADIAADAVRPDGRVLDATDRSVQVHACHGPARQVDVLREVLLGLLDDDPTLQPRDIVVLCPDIETYAPLIAAGFGLGDLAGEHHPAHTLRVQLADRALTQTNPLLGVATELLGVADSRATASGVLNLAQSAPVRARFAFTDDDLETIADWVREAGVRWSFDAEHREPYGLADIQHNTWRFGLDRILTGVAMSEDSRTWLGTALPLDDVGSNRVELAGRLAEFIARLQSAADTLTGARSVTGWITALVAAVDALTRVQLDDAWQQGQLHRELTEVVRRAGTHAETTLLLPDVRALLSGELAGRPTRANFRTGNLTVCTMVPMRSVPHRVVCLVGLDDGVFPRAGHVDGDDVLARQPLTGERDARSEDRQLLLDAVCAATETLVITYTGADEHTGKTQPPAVPLAELLDALDATTGAPVRGRVVVQQPLQPFDVRNVTRGTLGVPGKPFTFDPTARTAAEAAAGVRTEPVELFAAVLPAVDGQVELADLVTFFKDPVKGFFRALDYTLPWDVKGIEDTMPVEIGGLEQWAVGERMLGDMLRGMHPDDAANAEWRRGCLPPGRLGMRSACAIRDEARALAAAAIPHRTGDPAAYDVDIDLGGGRRLTGTVAGVYGTRTVSVTYSRLAPKHVLQDWIPLCALAAQHPGEPWSALCIGRSGDDDPARQRLFTAPADPLAVLRQLVAIYDAGRREPLPLPLKTSHAWADARRRHGDPLRAARSAWTGKYGDHTAKTSCLVWGVEAPLDRLLDPARPGEEIDGEATRLGTLAMRLWSPLLDAEGSL